VAGGIVKTIFSRAETLPNFKRRLNDFAYAFSSYPNKLFSDSHGVGSLSKLVAIIARAR